MTTQPTRVMIVDDHKLVRSGLRVALKELAGFDVVGEAANGEAAVRLSEELQPDVVLMDIKMPIMDGIAATRAITQSQPGVRVVALSRLADKQTVQAVLQAGAVSYLEKQVSVDELIEAIHAVSNSPSNTASRSGR